MFLKPVKLFRPTIISSDIVSTIGIKIDLVEVVQVVKEVLLEHIALHSG
jgi:hypothetical protein